MPIVGGLDIHRQQVTFDLADTVTGEAWRGQVRPADRQHLRAWLGRFAGRGQVHLAMEGCTGWRYVAGEVAAAGFTPHVGDPAEIAARRGRKKRAKTDRADARLQRELLEQGQFPECWVPPWPVLDWRQRLETYHDLRVQHTAWVQRIHAVLFHHGVPPCGDLSTRAALDRLEAACREQLTPAGAQQVAVALAQLDLADLQLGQQRAVLLGIAAHVTGPVVLARELYGVGPLTALAMTCWLGGANRFSASRKAVRFTGLDITVRASAGKRPPGHLSRQGPPVLRWCLYEAGKTSARPGGPGHDYYTAVKDRIDGKRAALSQARRLTRQGMHILAELGDDAFAPC
jgi:transposase